MRGFQFREQRQSKVGLERPDMATLADQIGEHPMFFWLL